MNDLRALAAAGDDPAAFAREFQKLSDQDGFNPFALIAGEPVFSAVLIVPFTPAIAGARERLLTDGSGPLAEAVPQLIAQGVPAGEALPRAQAMFRAAVGMCVVVLGGDHGLSTIPQLFFGHFAEDWRQATREACGASFPDQAGLDAALRELERLAASGVRFPGLIAGPHSTGGPLAAWRRLGDALITGVDRSLLPQARERLSDLAWWTSSALTALETGTRDDAATARLLRLHLLAGDAAAATAQADALARDLLADRGDEEAFVTALHRLVDTAIATACPDPVATWLESRFAALDAALGGSYDLRLARVRLAAAAGSDRIAATAADLIARNRKTARHDLTREPIWRVVADPGELLDTAAAAALIDRPAAFVAKRLEAGLIPAARSGDLVRIPRRALLAWYGACKALLD